MTTDQALQLDHAMDEPVQNARDAQRNLRLSHGLRRSMHCGVNKTCEAWRQGGRLIAAQPVYRETSGFSLALTSSSTVAGALQIKRDPRLSQGHPTQLIGLNDALDIVDAGNRNIETPIAIAPRDRARYASAYQFIESAR